MGAQRPCLCRLGARPATYVAVQRACIRLLAQRGPLGCYAGALRYAEVFEALYANWKVRLPTWAQIGPVRAARERAARVAAIAAARRKSVDGGGPRSRDGGASLQGLLRQELLEYAHRHLQQQVTAGIGACRSAKVTACPNSCRLQVRLLDSACASVAVGHVRSARG